MRKGINMRKGIKFVIFVFAVSLPGYLYAQFAEDRIKRKADEFLRLILNEGEYFVLTERIKPDVPMGYLPGFPGFFPWFGVERVGGIQVTVVLDEMVSKAKEELINDMLPKILDLDPKVDRFNLRRAPVWPGARPRVEIQAPTMPFPQIPQIPQVPQIPREEVPRRVESKADITVAGDVGLSGDVDVDMGDVEVGGKVGGKVEVGLPEVALRGGLRVEAPEGVTRSIEVSLRGAEGLLGPIGAGAFSLRRILPFILAIAGFLFLYALLSFILRRRIEEARAGVGAGAEARELIPPLFGRERGLGLEVPSVSVREEISKLAREKPEILASVLRKNLRIGIDGARSAAVLFRSLNLEGSIKVSNMLQREEFERILSEVRRLGELPQQEVERILTSIYVESLSELSIDSLLKGNPFTFLTYYSDDELLQAISDDTDEAIACLLVNAKPERAGVILEKLEPERRNRVVTIMHKAAGISDREVSKIAERIKSKLEGVERSSVLSSQGIDILQKTLENIEEPSTQEEILKNIREREPKLYDSLRKRFVFFSDVYKVPEEVLGEVVAGIEPSDLAAAFYDSPQSFKQILQRVLPRVRFQMMLDEIEKKGEFPKGDVSRARKIIISRIKALMEIGRIKHFE